MPEIPEQSTPVKIARGILTLICLICALALIFISRDIFSPVEGSDGSAILRFAGVSAVLIICSLLNGRLYFGTWQLWPPGWKSCPAHMSGKSARYFWIISGLGVAAVIVFLVLWLAPLSIDMKIVILLIGFILYAVASIGSFLFFESVWKDVKKPGAGPCNTPESVRENDPGAGSDTGAEQVCNPWYAAIFSGIVPGWGQWYTGRTLAGFVFNQGFFLIMFLFMAARIPTTQLYPYESLLTLLFTVFFLGFWIYGMHDAYQSAQKVNRGELAFSGKSLLFWFPAVAVIFFAAYVILILFAIAGVVMFGAVSPGAGISGDDFVDMNVSATVRQPDADHIVVTMQNVPDPDQIFEVYAKVTDDTGSTQTKILGLDYKDVVKGSSMKFSGAYAGSNHVTVNVVFDEPRNETQILDTYI